MKTSPTAVVSDADVIIHLAKLGRVSLLRELYECVSIPEHVRMEITSKDDFGITEAMDSYLIVHPSSQTPAVAIEEGFRVAGTIGIILRAAHIQAITISEAIYLLEQMRSEDFRIHPDLIQEAINTLRG